MKVVVIDGQGGKLGCMLMEAIRAAKLECRLLAVGTNSIATSAMLKAGADAGATGENPAIVASRDADVLLGPIGILAADALWGEVAAMAEAVARSKAVKILIPVNLCNIRVAGMQAQPYAKLIAAAVSELTELMLQKP